MDGDITVTDAPPLPTSKDQCRNGGWRSYVAWPPPTTDTGQAMSQENVEVVRRWWDGFNTTGMPPLELCDERIEIRNPPDFPAAGSFHGHQGVQVWRDQVFEVFDNASVEAEEIIDVTGDGETVLMLLRARGNARHTRIEIDFPWAAIWTIREGKLVFAQGYLSRQEAREVVGLSE